MKVHIGPYKNWFGPYQLAELLCFWVKEVPGEYGIKSRPDWVYKFGDWLAHGNAPDEDDKPRSRRLRRDRPETLLYKALSWIHSKRKRKVEIRIDKYDTWSMDSTLSPIILPMLKQLKATKQGSGYVDMEDVPEHLRAYTTEDYDSQEAFDFYHEANVEGAPDVHVRFDWALDEMIWAFEQMQPDCDWEDQYSTGEIDFYSEVCKIDAEGKPLLYEMKHGPDHTHKTDWEGRQKHQDRISNGLRLFGKYFQTLWD